MLDSGIYLGNCKNLLLNLDNESVRTIHTSPPYNIGKNYKDYMDFLDVKEYLSFISEVIKECYRILIKGGSLFWQTGYTDNGNGFIYPIDHLTFSIFNDIGFKMKDRIIWRYYGGMSFKQKFTNKHETIIWWVKPGNNVYFNIFQIRERTKELDPRNNLFGCNPGNVWEVDRVAFGSANQTSHIAVFPEEISDRIILSSTKETDICLDPFSGSGTLCKVAKSRGRKYIGFEISEVYYKESIERINRIQYGEFLNVLSEIILKNILKIVKSISIDEVISNINIFFETDYIKNLRKYISDDIVESIKKKEETKINKKQKRIIWLKLIDFFNRNIKSDIIRTVDDAFLSRYKLHKRFNETMRLYKSLEFLEELKGFVSMDYDKIFNVIVKIAKDESQNYVINDDIISLKNNNIKLKNENIMFKLNL
jgi:adenine-specific DNA-methyltransferase